MTSTVSPSAVYCESARNGRTAQTRMRRPPIVGVPCFTRCVARALGADLLAEVARAQRLDEPRPDDDAGDHRQQAGDQDWDHVASDLRDLVGDAFEPDRARGLDEDGVARAEEAARGLDRSLDVGRPDGRSVGAGGLADADDVDRRALPRGRRSARGSVSEVSPSSAISPSIATRRLVAGRGRRGAPARRASSPGSRCRRR